MIPGWDPNFASLCSVFRLAITRKSSLSPLHAIPPKAVSEVFSLYATAISLSPSLSLPALSPQLHKDASTSNPC
jgi:hypothetical protein